MEDRGEKGKKKNSGGRGGLATASGGEGQRDEKSTG